MSAQLALKLDPPTPRKAPEDGFDVYVAPETGPEPTGPLPLIASCARAAEMSAACIAATTTDRCLALPARHWSDELMEIMDIETREAEKSLQRLRKIHADILGIPLEDLDARMAADKAKENAERAERRASVPKRAPRGKPAADTAVIGASRLTERQRDLLSNVRVEDNVAVYVPEERIADWSALKVVMTALGGKWKTKKGFLFPDDVDAAEAVRLAIATGEIIDPIAAGFYPTPSSLADRVVELAQIRDCDTVLEPSAGRGAIALAVRRAHPNQIVLCVEALEDNVLELRRLGFDAVIRGDFLTTQLVSYGRIVANPPFGKRQDILHVRRMFEHLKPDGRLVSIMSAGVVYRQDKLAREFRELVDSLGGYFEENPDGSFLESGTGVRTVTLVVPKGTP